MFQNDQTHFQNVAAITAAITARLLKYAWHF